MTAPLKPEWLAWPETKKLTGIFAKHKVEFRFVGGCVRDALLHQTAEDIDAATPLAPEHIIDLLETENIKTVPTGIEHGTVTAIVGKQPFQITTLRKDTACDGRHAAVEYTEDWEEDARRRDFTINAFYLSPEGKLFDYFHGKHDLEHGIVRFIGKADDRVQEDFLRILRFFRFHARYAKGAPDAEAMVACKKHAPQIAMLSGERIQQEMGKLLRTEAPLGAMTAMKEAGVLDRVLPRAELECLARLSPFSKNPPPELKLAVLMAHASDKDIASLAARWKLPNVLVRYLSSVLSAKAEISPDMSLAAQKKLLRRLGKEIYIAAIAVAATSAGEVSSYHALLELPEKWTPPVFPVTGADLIAKGIPEGRELGDRLRALEEAWEASDYSLSKKQLLTKI